jgi:parallel beta-helix repeat protein
MAISANAVYEVRTTGTQTGGAFFVTGASGTDYSQQPNPQYDITDASAAGAGMVITTAAAAADMVGNGLFAVGGTNVTANKRYEILSVNVGVSITVAGAANLMSGAGSSDVHVHIGGAFLMGGTLDDDFTEDLQPGNLVYVQNGTYTIGENVSQAKDGSTALFIKWIGYISTRTTTPYGTDRPIFAFGANNCTWGDRSKFSNISFTTTAAAGITTGTTNIFVNCKVVNSSASAGRYGVGDTGGLVAVACEFISTNGIAVNCASYSANLNNCYIHDSNVGVTIGSQYTNIISCVIDTCVTGVSLGATTQNIITNCTIYGCTTGIAITTGTDNRFINSIITGCTTGASCSSALYSNLFDYCCWNNGAGDTSNLVKGPHDITADPLLADPANGNFTLAAGSPCFNAGATLGTSTGL